MQQVGLSAEAAESIGQRIRVDYSIQFIAGLIQQGRAEGSIRPDVDPGVAARTALSMLYGVCQLWFLQGRAFSLADEAEGVVDLFVRGIACASP
jgi:hypothetical protein